MGFRGEALASIAAIAQVEMKTKRHSEETGTLIIIEGSNVVNHQASVCAEGTSISVKNLFFNVPARRNFLKSNTVEARHIIDEFQRAALAHPEISFSLQQNGMDVFKLPAASLRQRITALLGSASNEKLVPVAEETSLLKINGFVGKPEFAKKTRGEQFFFINKRFIRDAYLNHAVVNAFEELLPRDAFPSYFLHMEMDPARIDINIHPTKTEVKFDDERSVYAIVRAAVKHALGQFSIAPSIDFDVEKSFEPQASATLHSAPVTSGGTPAIVSPPSFMQKRTEQREWRNVFEGIRDASMREVFAKPEVPAQQFINPEWNSELLAEDNGMLFQLHRKYIVSQVSSGLAIIDQQAAHYRILYEKYIKQMESAEAAVQQQLFPQTLEFSLSDSKLLHELLPHLHPLGFDLREFGRNSFVLHGTPQDVEHGKEQQILERMLEQYKNNAPVKMSSRENLARSVAKNLSISSGKILSIREMKKIVDELFACALPFQSPEGKPTVIVISDSELDDKFKA
jgi:DNA mismatch repair protein MutL